MQRGLFNKTRSLPPGAVYAQFKTHGLLVPNTAALAWPGLLCSATYDLCQRGLVNKTHRLPLGEVYAHLKTHGLLVPDTAALAWPGLLCYAMVRYGAV